MAHEVLRAGQGAHVAQLCGEQARVRPLELGRLLLAQLVSRLARQTIRQQSTTHPDAPMDAPDGQVDAAQLEGLVPGDGVLVHAVGKGAVEVEQESRAVDHGGEEEKTDKEKIKGHKHRRGPSIVHGTNPTSGVRWALSGFRSLVSASS